MQIIRYGNLDMPIRTHRAIVGVAMQLADMKLTYHELVAELTKLQVRLDQAARHDELLRIKAATVHDDVWSINDDGQVISLNDRVEELSPP